MTAPGPTQDEQALQRFYGAYPYPPPAWTLERPNDSDLFRAHICEEVGNWAHDRIPFAPKIWVAGCGTNQAVMTALRFPSATVYATDLSAEAIRITGAQAQSINLSNLVCEVASIRDVCHEELFDYVICTGVIHHDRLPGDLLLALADALAPDGILELMVYNDFHRQEVRAFQQALVALGADEEHSPGERVSFARRLAIETHARGRLGDALQANSHLADSAFADAFAHPRECSYTVASLEATATKVGLHLMAPCSTAVDMLRGASWWPGEWRGDTREAVDKLGDVERWHVVNLLWMDMSPMLWFYLEHEGRPRMTEAAINQDFLSWRFEKADRGGTRLVRTDNGPCGFQERPVDVVPLPRDRTHSSVHEAVTPLSTMAETLAALELKLDISALSRLRVALTSASSPLITAVANSRLPSPRNS